MRSWVSATLKPLPRSPQCWASQSLSHAAAFGRARPVRKCLELFCCVQGGADIPRNRFGCLQYPEPRGCARWVQHAKGSRHGWQPGALWCSWMRRPALAQLCCLVAIGLFCSIPSDPNTSCSSEWPGLFQILPFALCAALWHLCLWKGRADAGLSALSLSGFASHPGDIVA